MHEITTWQGISQSYSQGPVDDPDQYCNLGANCYAGHNGIDFQHDNQQTDEPVYSAFSGTVINTPANPLITNYPNYPSTCPNNLYGNQVWIDHHNGYATLYGHLAKVNVQANQEVLSHQQLGIMGNSGNSGGTHLHFGVYFDKNNDGIWTSDEVVDPYGWNKQPDQDPWFVKSGIASVWLWKYPQENSPQVDASGGTYTSLSGKVNVTVPPGGTDPNHT